MVDSVAIFACFGVYLTLALFVVLHVLMRKANKETVSRLEALGLARISKEQASHDGIVRQIRDLEAQLKVSPNHLTPPINNKRKFIWTRLRAPCVLTGSPAVKLPTLQERFNPRAEPAALANEVKWATGGTGGAGGGETRVKKHGILKAHTSSPEDAIEHRLAAQHGLLLEFQKKLEQLHQAVGKLLIRSDDISALESIVASNESLEQGLPRMLSNATAEHERVLKKEMVILVDTVQGVVERSLQTQLQLKDSTVATPDSARSARPSSARPQSSANKYLISHRDILSAEAQTGKSLTSERSACARQTPNGWPWN